MIPEPIFREKNNAANEVRWMRAKPSSTRRKNANKLENNAKKTGVKLVESLVNSQNYRFRIQKQKE